MSRVHSKPEGGLSIPTEKTDGPVVEPPSKPACFDKRGIPIERGDIVKVFHFIGARNKHHYMYKQCLGVGRYPNSPEGWSGIFFSHLNFLDSPGDLRNGGPYHEAPGQHLVDYEIVQSLVGDYEARRMSECQPHSPTTHSRVRSREATEGHNVQTRHA